MSEEDGTNYEVSLSVGQIDVSASGEDPEEVERLADEKLEDGVEIARELGIHEDDETYHVEAGAGWLIAHGDGETPEEALAQWEAMWERMLSDVEELSDKEREQAGLARQ
jgi:predicted RNase H-like HicB family nuclease